MHLCNNISINGLGCMDELRPEAPVSIGMLQLIEKQC